MSDLVIHGHFYQPPRENPWTGLIDRESSAYPYHDWNERIEVECYRPNAFARIVDTYGRVEHIVNNYASISFNFGPTLLSWVERKDTDTYARIIQADQTSVQQHDGHGNAIAQAYNHVILPLASERDRRTQIRWGVADFRHRFAREPESLWLPETACNDSTLAALIEEGMKYVILSPSQAERVRSAGSSEWRSVSDGSIDGGIAYRYAHRDGSGRSIAVFFYDASIARAIAFEGALASSQSLVEKLAQAQAGEGRLVHVATDGESYGHHTHFGERGLAYALLVEAPAKDLVLTNYGSFLERHPPAMEVEIKEGPNGEGTAWSCAHGVGRWCRDCGCQTGGREDWNQAWRAPLREALDHLRDEAVTLFEQLGTELFADPWAARDAYIEVLLDRSRRDEWLKRHQRRLLDGADSVRALSLLELQRSALLMYTSCGWFFTEISGIETVQVLKYAGRTLDYFDELGVPSPHKRFLEILAQASSNLPEYGNGADVFRRFAEPCRVLPRSVAVSLAISSLMGEHEQEGRVAEYAFRRSLFRKEQHGRLTMATGRLELEHIPTGRRLDFARLALHLGGVDFYCAMRSYTDGVSYKQADEAVWSYFRSASIPEILRLAHDHFGPDEYGLSSVLEESRRNIADLVYGDVLRSLAGDYDRVYRQNERIIQMLEEAGIELPAELHAVAELALTHQLEDAILAAERTGEASAYEEVIRLARRVAGRAKHILRPSLAQLLEALVTNVVATAIAKPDTEDAKRAIPLVELAAELQLERGIERAQELWIVREVTPPYPLEVAQLGQALRFSVRLHSRHS